MKVIAFNGSPRKNGNTEKLIEEIFSHLKKEDIECEIVNIAHNPLRGCIACNGCKKTGYCVLNDDLNAWFDKAIEADAIIIGSPVYFANVTAETKAFIDRIGRLARKDFRFKRKPLVAVTAQRRAGALPTFDAINHMGQINQMLMLGSTYWNLGFGYEKGEIDDDTEAMQNMENIAHNLSWLIKKIN